MLPTRAVVLATVACAAALTLLLATSTPSALPGGGVALAVVSRAPPPRSPPTAAATPKRVISLNVFFVSYHRDSTPAEIAAALAADAAGGGGDTGRYLNRYFLPLVNVIVNWRWLLPDWTVRVYISQGHPFVGQLRALGAEVVEMPFDPVRWSAATAWRFLVEDDAGVDAWASRESEAPPTFQDAAPLLHWLRSDLPLHNLAMVPQCLSWHAGTWGARRGFITAAINSTVAAALASMAERWRAKGSRPFGTRYGDDQAFMAEALWKQVRAHANGINYRAPAIAPNHSFCTYKHCVPFPAYPDGPGDYPAFRASMNKLSPNTLVLCHHAAAPHCRRHSWPEGTQAWRGLFELCTGQDFFTGAPLQPAQRAQLGFVGCPYDGVAAADAWAASGAVAAWTLKMTEGVGTVT